MVHAIILAFALASAAAGCKVEIQSQLSSSPCKAGTDYGCFDANNSMWTNNGCRAVFLCGEPSKVVTCESNGNAFVGCSCNLIQSPVYAPAAVLVVGDSYAKNSGNYLSVACPGKSVVNMGVLDSTAAEWGAGSCPGKGSCSAAHLVSALHTNFSYVWFSVGGNDFIFEACVDVMWQLSNKIKSAIAAVKAAAPAARILMTGYCIPPAPLNFFGGVMCARAQDISILNGAIKTACDSEPVCTFVDATGACGGTKSTFSNRKFFADQIHVNQLGYGQIFGMQGVQDFLGCSNITQSTTPIVAAFASSSSRSFGNFTDMRLWMSIMLVGTITVCLICGLIWIVVGKRPSVKRKRRSKGVADAPRNEEALHAPGDQAATSYPIFNASSAVVQTPQSYPMVPLTVPATTGSVNWGMTAPTAFSQPMYWPGAQRQAYQPLPGTVV